MNGSPHWADLSPCFHVVHVEPVDEPIDEPFDGPMDEPAEALECSASRGPREDLSATPADAFLAES